MEHRRASEAARAASRANGAKSRGPRTARGKEQSAKNAVKHGLRARRAIRPEELPPWIAALEARIVFILMGEVTQHRREQLDLLISTLVLIDAADRAIADEFARLHAALEGSPNPANAGALLALDLAPLRKLIAYRRRFRAQRDQCLKRIVHTLSNVARELFEKAAARNPG